MLSATSIGYYLLTWEFLTQTWMGQIPDASWGVFISYDIWIMERAAGRGLGVGGERINWEFQTQLFLTTLTWANQNRSTSIDGQTGGQQPTKKGRTIANDANYSLHRAHTRTHTQANTRTHRPPHFVHVRGVRRWVVVKLNAFKTEIGPLSEVDFKDVKALNLNQIKFSKLRPK